MQQAAPVFEALCLMKQSSLTLSLWLLFLLGCSDGSSAISAQIAAQFDASKSAPIDLSVVGPASWERVCVLSPYTTNQTAERILGFKWDAESKTSIAGSDGINVLVFIENQQVVAYTEHPRNRGDFSKLQPRCLSRSQAGVKRELGSGGWVYLVAP
ncbi:hypothetical protein D3C78_544360 [compost metagenome]